MRPLFVKLCFLLIPTVAYASEFDAFIKPTDWNIDQSDTYADYKEYISTAPFINAPKYCGYGDRCDGDPESGSVKHTGVDYDQPSGSDNVYAANHGQVVAIQENGPKGAAKDHAMGNVVVLEHFCEPDYSKCSSGKIFTLYAHLDTIDQSVRDAHEKRGTRDGWIARGQVIGRIGGTKYGYDHRDYNASPYNEPSQVRGWPQHLHFEVKTKPVIGSANRGEWPCTKVDFHWTALPTLEPYYGYTPMSPTDCGYRNPADYIGQVTVHNPWHSGSYSNPPVDLPPLPEFGSVPPPVSGTNYTGSKPDLKINSLEPETADHVVTNTFHIGESARCRMQIKNIGTANAGAFQTSCYISDGFKTDDNPTDVGKEDTQGLAAGATHTEHEDFIAPEYPGQYNMMACTDSGGTPPNGQVQELNEKNQCLEQVPFTVWSNPNLTLTQVFFSNGVSLYDPGQLIPVHVSAANIGENIGRDIRIGWYITGGVYGSEVVFLAYDNIKRENLKGGMTHGENLDTFVAPSAPGHYTLIARIDYDGRVTETNEADNELRLPFTVRGMPTDDDDVFQLLLN